MLFNIENENDASFHDFMPKLSGMPYHETSYKYLTEELRINFIGGIKIGLTIFTGNPNNYGFDPDQGPYGTYEENEYRGGVLYFQIGPFKFGPNNETIRDKTQNWFHDLTFIHTPRFPIDRKKHPNKWFWQLGW